LSGLGRCIGTRRRLVRIGRLGNLPSQGDFPVNVRFVVTKPASKATTFPVRLPLLVGRSEEAKFRIQQDRVSRKHCEFFEQDGGVYLRDLGSTNGTFLNGELIETSAKVPLEPGAIVKVGSLEFRVEFEAAGKAPAPQPVVDHSESDKTVGVAHADDSEHLRFEHESEPVREPAEAEAEEPGQEPAGESVEDSPAIITAEMPVPADEAFGFLAGDNDPKPAPDDDQLGDFLKGLK